MALKDMETRTDLHRHVHAYTGVSLPGRVITPGHSTPLDFVFDATANPGRDMAVWANRGGAKTLCASVVAALEFATQAGPISARVLAGSEDQARILYEYWHRWCKSALLAGKLAGTPGTSLTVLANGEIEILPASQKQVRGPRVQRLFRDEVDEIDPEVYAASVGMLTSRAGVPARSIDTSTWHRAGGPMGRLVAEADRRGVRVHKWNIWEVLAACPRDRHDDGRGCRTCRLARPCLEKAREAAASVLRATGTTAGEPVCSTAVRRAVSVRKRAGIPPHGGTTNVERLTASPSKSAALPLGVAAACKGLMSIDDAIRQFSQWSVEQWQAEAECRRPALAGLVYGGFDRCIHVRADVARRDDLPTWRAIDWGWQNFVCLWLQADKHGNVFVVDELHAGQATTAENARRVRAADGERRIEATYCDPAGAGPSDQTGYSDVDVFASLGVPCAYTTTPWARDVRNGINLVRAYLRPGGGPPRLFIAPRCRRLIECFESYRVRQVNGEYVDEPIKPQPADHAMDALRYFFVNHAPPMRTETRLLSYA